MPVFRAQVSFENDSGLPEDRSINSWHFDTGGINPLGAQFDTVSGLIHKFYDVAVSPSLALSDYMSSNLQGTMFVDWYNLDQSPPRVPVHQTSHVISPGGAALPNEIAAVLSFHGPLVSGVNHARRRGRIYLGPLSSGAVATTGTVTKLESGFRLAVRRSARRALADFEAAGVFVWSVVSSGARDNTNQAIPYEDRPLLPRQNVPVVAGWVDDAIDIQRRRGLDALVRETWDNALPA